MAEQVRPLPNAGTLPTRIYRFEDLRLQVDHRLQIEPSAAPAGKRFYTRLLGYLKGSSLIVRLPAVRNGSTPLSEGDHVTVRGFSGRIAYVFHSDILKIRYAPYPYCHLSFPGTIQGAEIRKAVRVRVNMPARLTNPKLGSDAAMEAVITDLSALGVQTESAVRIGEPGDSVTIAFRFWIQPNDYEVNFDATGVIQNANPTNGEEPGWHHGIRFHGMRSTEALLLQHLLYEHLIEKNTAVV